MKKFTTGLIFVSISLFTAATHAQEVPKEIKPIFPKKGGKSRDHMSLNSLTAAQKRFLTENTSINPNGYLLVEVPSNYVDQISNLDMTRGFDVSPHNKSVTFEGLSLVGERQEGPYRKAYFFGDRTGAQEMVTIFHYKAAGAAMVGFSEFVNQKLDGMEGTLSLATSSESSKCLWKLTIANDETAFEVVVTDQLSNQKPSMPVGKVMAKMRKLIEFTMTTK